MPTNIKQSYNSDKEPIYPKVILDCIEEDDKTGYDVIHEKIVDDSNKFEFTGTGGLNINEITVDKINVKSLYANIAQIQNIDIKSESEPTKTAQVLHLIDDLGCCHNVLATAHNNILLENTGSIENSPYIEQSSTDASEILLKNTEIETRVSEILEEENAPSLEDSSLNGIKFINTGNLMIDTPYLYINSETNSIEYGDDIKLSHKYETSGKEINNSYIGLDKDGISIQTTQKQQTSPLADIEIISGSNIVLKADNGEITEKCSDRIYLATTSKNNFLMNETNRLLRQGITMSSSGVQGIQLSYIKSPITTLTSTITLTNDITLDPIDSCYVVSTAEIKSNINKYDNVYTGCPIGSVVMWMDTDVPQHWISLASDFSINLDNDFREIGTSYDSDNRYISIKTPDDYYLNIMIADSSNYKYKRLFETVFRTVSLVISSGEILPYNTWTKVTLQKLRLASIYIPSIAGRVPLCYRNTAWTDYPDEIMRLGSTGGKAGVQLDHTEVPLVQHVHQVHPDLTIDMGRFTSGGKYNNSFNNTKGGAGSHLTLKDASTYTCTRTDGMGNVPVYNHDNMQPYYALNFIIKYE